MKIFNTRQFFWLSLLQLIFLLSSCSMTIEDFANMSSIEMIEYKTRGVRNARITVGIVQNGQMSFTVFGENARVLPNREYIYEIGSISKAITGHLFARAVHENLLTLGEIDVSIGNFLNLSPNGNYPTIRSLMTHTSGYKFQEDYIFTLPQRTSPFENPFYGVTRRMVFDHIKRINFSNRSDSYEYSNSGIAVASLVLESIFNKDYASLVNSYFSNLGLNNTRIGDGRGNLSHYWRWNNGNPYIAAGGIVSSITDMMKFAQMQMDPASYASYSHKVWADVPPGFNFPELGVRADAIGLGWFIDRTHNVIWHGGSTDTFDTYLGFDKDNEIAVVVLSNIRSRGLQTFVIGSRIFKEIR